MLERLISSILNCFSQIMLQQNTVIGFLFALGIGVNSPTMLFGATLAILSSLVFSTLYRYNSCAIHQGLYGYNAALAGIAVLFFLPLSLLSCTLVILAGCVSTMIMHFFQHKLPQLPAFTAPFIITTWILLIVLDLVGIDRLVIPFKTDNYGDFFAVMRGVGQVMFQANWLSGLVFSLALLLYSAKLAISAMIGSLLGVVIARYLGFSEDWLVMGLYGFNASLSAIVLMTHCPHKKWLIMLGVTMSILLTRFFEIIPLAALTAPFVLSSWLILVLVKMHEKNIEQS